MMKTYLFWKRAASNFLVFNFCCRNSNYTVYTGWIYGCWTIYRLLKCTTLWRQQRNGCNGAIAIFIQVNFGGEAWRRQYSSTAHRDHIGYGLLAPKYRPKTSFTFIFVTSRQDWLGIAKPKNVFRLNMMPSMKLI